MQRGERRRAVRFDFAAEVFGVFPLGFLDLIWVMLRKGARTSTSARKNGGRAVDEKQPAERVEGQDSADGGAYAHAEIGREAAESEGGFALGGSDE